MSAQDKYLESLQVLVKANQQLTETVAQHVVAIQNLTNAVEALVNVNFEILNYAVNGPSEEQLGQSLDG